VPITLAPGVKGVTRNVSASGVYFETDLPLAVGNPLRFEVSFDGAPGGPVRIRCAGKVVRVEPLERGVGVGASIERFDMERAGA
jgi:PilZ domain